MNDLCTDLTCVCSQAIGWPQQVAGTVWSHLHTAKSRPVKPPRVPFAVWYEAEFDLPFNGLQFARMPEHEREALVDEYHAAHPYERLKWQRD